MTSDVKFSKEILQEIAWDRAGAAYDVTASGSTIVFAESGTAGQCLEVLENTITNVEKYSYNRRITFKLGTTFYQYTARMGHEGDHEYDEPYIAVGVPFQGVRYVKR